MLLTLAHLSFCITWVTAFMLGLNNLDNIFNVVAGVTFRLRFFCHVVALPLLMLAGPNSSFQVSTYSKDSYFYIYAFSVGSIGNVCITSSCT